jgi:hypothetical protein
VTKTDVTTTARIEYPCPELLAALRVADFAELAGPLLDGEALVDAADREALARLLDAAPDVAALLAETQET